MNCVKDCALKCFADTGVHCSFCFSPCGIKFRRKSDKYRAEHRAKIRSLAASNGVEMWDGYKVADERFIFDYSEQIKKSGNLPAVITTITPLGEENQKRSIKRESLKPGASIFTYMFPQSMKSDVYQRANQDNAGWMNPYVFRREEVPAGAPSEYGVVQMWPVTNDDGLRKKHDIKIIHNEQDLDSPDARHAWKELREVLTKLFGELQVPICSCVAKEEKEVDDPVFVGAAKNLIAFMKTEEAQNYLNIDFRDDHHFSSAYFNPQGVARVTKATRNKMKYDFGVQLDCADEKFIAYTREARGSFTCIKLWAQFEKEGIRQSGGELVRWVVRGLHDLVDEKTKQLGPKGTNGTVWEVSHKRDKNVKYAMKELHCDASFKMQREFDLLRALIPLPHPCLVRSFFADQTRKPPVIVMEVADSSLEPEVTKADTSGQASLEAKKWIWHIYQGLRFLHSKGILHRDLKPGNVLLVKNPDGDGSQAKLTDFGNSKIVQGTYGHAQDTYGHPPGTPGYDAPEVIEKAQYGTAADLYSYGITVWAVFTGEIPEMKMDKDPLYMRPKYRERYTHITGTSKVFHSSNGINHVFDVSAFTISLIALDPQQRPKHKGNNVPKMLNEDSPEFDDADIEPDHWSFMVGSRVELVNLVGEDINLNGKQGELFSYTDRTGNWSVKLDDGTYLDCRKEKFQFSK